MNEDILNSPSSPPVKTKNMVETGSDTNDTSKFGTGFLSGDQELEQDGWSLCVVIFCALSCGGGGSSNLQEQ